MTPVAQLIAAERARTPQVVQLAEAASLAALVEAELLRALRLHCVPGADASVEADLWFGPLVSVRSPGVLAFDGEVVAELRRQVALDLRGPIETAGARERVERITGIIASIHAGAPPLLRLEEAVIAGLVLGTDPAELDEKLRSVLGAMAHQLPRRRALASWAWAALPRLPLDHVALPSAGALCVATGLAMKEAMPMPMRVGTGALAGVPSQLVSGSGSVELSVRRSGAWLEIEHAGDGVPPQRKISVPATTPRYVEVVTGTGDSTLVALAPQGTGRVNVEGAVGVRLRSLDGTEWKLARARRAEPAVIGHALLIGTLGESVDRDLRVMAEMLRERGFSLDVRTGDRATRAGILAAYDELIAKVRPDEATVVYYSGPGFSAIVETESRRSWQGIVPVDLDASTTTDFRGITAWELSIKAAQLTQRTRNVTLIFDCCYAFGMSPGGSLGSGVPQDELAVLGRSRSLPHPARLGFDAHLHALRDMYGVAVDALDPVGYPSTVRLAACGEDEAAFAYPVDGEYRGAFTEALVTVLREVGDVPVSWAAMEGAIRGRVRDWFPSQHPVMDGPVRRRPFTLDEQDVSGAVTITPTSDGFMLGGGHLTGIWPGDVYGVMPPGTSAYRSADAIAEVIVRETSAATAEAVLLDWKNGHSSLPERAIAVPVKKTAIRSPVRIDVPASARAMVTAEIDATGILRLAVPKDPERALATLRLEGDALSILDERGPLYPPARFPDELRATIRNLANLAVAQRMRELEGEHGVLASELEIEWGTVDHGQMRRLPEHGSALALRDRVWVKVENRAQRALHVHIFNVGIRGDVTLLTSDDPAGVSLTAERPEFVLGRGLDGTLTGLDVVWPDMPRDQPRLDELVVIVTSSPADLRGLESVEHVGDRRPTSSKLGDVFAQLQEGPPQDLRSSEPRDGFFVKRLSYLLHPRDEVQAAAPREVEVPETEEVIGSDTDFGIVIGIERPLDLPSLRGGNRDVKDFYDWLCDADGGGLARENVRLLVSSQDPPRPRQRDIDRALDELIRAAHARGGGRRLYFYFSGLCAKGPLSSPGDVALLLPGSPLHADALSLEGYRDQLCGLGLFQELTMFVDCGRPVSTVDRGMPPQITSVQRTPPRTTRLFVAAAVENPSAFESLEDRAWQGGFTARLLSILRESPNAIPARELRVHLEKFGPVNVTNGLLEDSRFGARRTPRLLP